MVEYGAIMWNPYIICFFALESASVHLVFQCSFCMNSLCENSCAQQSWGFFIYRVSAQRTFETAFVLFPHLSQYSYARRTCANIGINTSRCFFPKPGHLFKAKCRSTKTDHHNSTDVRGLLPNEFFHLTPLLFLEILRTQHTLKAKYLEYLVLPLKTW